MPFLKKGKETRYSFKNMIKRKYFFQVNGRLLAGVDHLLYVLIFDIDLID
jgi:hypothetical protein